MTTHMPKNKSDSGKGTFKRHFSNKLNTRRTPRKDSDSVTYNKREELRILNDFFTQPNYLDDYLF